MSEHEDLFHSMVSDVESWRADLGVPGATFGLAVDGGSHTAGVGVTSVDNPLPVNDETLFQIGSITKTLTATLMMRLAEQGKLDLDARARAYLPDFRVRDSDAGERVTLRQLVTHVGGWTGDIFTDTGNGDDAAQRYVESMADFKQLAPLGALFSYNNAAFCVAGRVIEVVSGKTFEAAARELIFEPLGMERSFFFPQEAMLRRFAVGHVVDEEKAARVVSPWPIPRAMNAAGGISCHIKDLLRYGVYHLGDGAPLLRGDSLRLMHSPQVEINAWMGAVGLAWIMNAYDGTKLLWHNGGTNGQCAVLTLVPERGLALGMISNSNNGAVLNERFQKRVLRDFCGVVIPEPQAIASSAEELAGFEGDYKGTMNEIELRMAGGELMATIRNVGRFPSDGHDAERAPAPAPIARCGADELLVLDGAHENARADIIRDASGEIRYLRFGARLHVRQ